MQSVFIRRTATTNEMRRNLEKGLTRAGLELEEKKKLNILTSKPAGRTYRTTAIVRNRKGLKGLRKRGKRGLIVGSNFYRASKIGQPPAIRTGRLLNSIYGRKLGRFLYRVGTNVYYGAILDAKDGLNRPFFESIARNYNRRFFAIMVEAAKP